MDAKSFKKDVGENALNQIGFLAKDLDINLYDFFKGMGDSPIGKEMDQLGRYLFNHRFGGGHLWWKELANRPVDQWLDVLEHLLSDFFTKAGLPYAFDGTMVGPNLLKMFGSGKNAASYNNWAMLNGFEFISGASSIIFSIYDAATLSKGYTSDISLALDGAFIALNILGGIATANPFLLIAAAIKTTTVLRKSQMPLGIETSSPFDLDTNKMFGLDYSFDLDVDRLFGITGSFDLDVDRLFGITRSFDFMFESKCVSYDSL